MERSSGSTALPLTPLEKVQSGIRGLDAITNGGLPKGRTTLICGGPGSGKTLFGMEFLVKGTTQFNEPGVLISFEETEDELAKNVASLGFDIKRLETEKKLFIEYVRIERSEIEETGEYDLEALFLRISHAVSKVGAKRVVLDTLEALFSGLKDTSILRAEIRRLFRFLRDRGLTAVVTAEIGEGDKLTRHGLEEYVSDCVIVLDNRVKIQVSTRRLRIVKYRGSLHGTNEYPFLIDDSGLFVMPVTSLMLKHHASNEFVPTGVKKLDQMLDDRGYYRGSTILVTGYAGTGKTSLAAHFVAAACGRGEKALYFSFEESPDQLTRNMQSIGIDFAPFLKAKTLKFSTTRPSYYGLEQHLANMIRIVNDFEPNVVAIDPMSDLIALGDALQVKMMLTRLIDYLKNRGITAFFTNLLSYQTPNDMQAAVSSLIDTWLFLRDVETNGERTRVLQVMKSRGMKHSNQLREFIMTKHGVDLIDVYVGPEGVLTGSARKQQIVREALQNELRFQDFRNRQTEIEQKRKVLESEYSMRRTALENEELSMKNQFEQAQERERRGEREREVLGTERSGPTKVAKIGGR